MQPSNGSAVPLCSICLENLGKYGGPATLPCGHNYCLQCIASSASQKADPECTLCRAPFSQNLQLHVNTELRDLVKFATSLHTVEQDGWETVTASKGQVEGEEAESDVRLVPSAPPMHVSLTTVLQGGGDLLSLEPPKWMPDSHAPACRLCVQDFQSLRRHRHHCRLCGEVFCGACSKSHLLLPPKFQQKQPQRVCQPCADVLEPLQPFLAGTISQAVQPAVHDVTDSTSMRSWFNRPVASSLEAEIYKATNIVHAFTRIGNNPPERHIPSHILKDAAGFAILSTFKVGMGWSGVVGTGLVIGQEDGAWTSPSAISLAGVGRGLQLGSSVSDILIVLRNWQALQAFCGRVHVGAGVGGSMAVGTVGRQAEAAMRLGAQGGAMCYSYSMSSGIFAGISIEGSVVSTRDHINLAFYGRPVTAKQLLVEGKLPSPVAAAALYSAMDNLLVRLGAPTTKRYVDAPKKVVPTPSSPQPANDSPHASPPEMLANSLHAHHVSGGIQLDTIDTGSDEEDTGLGRRGA